MNDAVTVCCVDRFCSNMPAIAQDGDRIAEAKDFLQAMGDIDDSDAALFKLREQLEEMLTFASRKRTGGLIHDDYLCVRSEGGSNLDDLFLAGGKLVDGLIGINFSLDL